MYGNQFDNLAIVQLFVYETVKILQISNFYKKNFESF